MASFSIHLAIAKKYCDRHPDVANPEALCYGAIAPDLASDKAQSHYSRRQENENLVSSLANKVWLYDFVQNHELHDDKQKGIFLHLLTDFLFYNYFFAAEYLQNVSEKEFARDLIYSYDVTDGILDAQYGTKNIFSDELRAKLELLKYDRDRTGEVEKNILPPDRLEKFIADVAQIDLEKYRQKILAERKNVLP